MAFVLAGGAGVACWSEPSVNSPPELQTLPEFQTLMLPPAWEDVLSGWTAEILVRRVLPQFLGLQRWYADKEAMASTVALVDWVSLASGAGGCALALIDVSREGAEPQRYSLPLAVAWETDTDDPLTRLQPQVLARVRRGSQVGVLYDAAASESLPRLIFDAVGRGLDIQTAAGACLACRPTAAFDEFRDVTAHSTRRLGVEQSNSSLLIDDRVIVKLYRRLQAGVHPEVEIGRFLTDVAHFTNAPRLLGSVEMLAGDGAVTAIALVQEFIRNQGDGWALTLDHLDRALNARGLMLPSDKQACADSAVHEGYWLQAEVLGRRIGDLHRAFAMDVADPAFAPDAITDADIEAWSGQIAELAARARESLGRAVVSARLSDAVRTAGDRLLANWGAIEVLATLPAPALAGTVKTRIHGDLHLGQVVVAGADFHILDFEGEPLHPLQRRRAKSSPLRDVAGMIRSFDYAGHAILQRRGTFSQASEAAAAEREAVNGWRSTTTARFLAAYREAVAGCRSLPPAEADLRSALNAFLLEKALYEICYEAANRPDWLGIPLQGVLRLLGRADVAV